MDRQLNYKMKGRMPILIASLTLLTLASVSFIRIFFELTRNAEYYFYDFAGAMSWVSLFTGIVIDAVAVIIFSVYMLKGRTNTKGGLPTALILFAITDIAVIFIRSVGFLIEYSYFPYFIAYCIVELFISAGFIMMMVCVNQNFENRIFFFVSCGVGTMAQLAGIALKYYRLELDTFVALLVFGIFFVFGFLNGNGTSIDADEAEATFAPVQRVPVAQPQNEAAISELYNPGTIKLQSNGELSPEHQLLFWKENFEKGLITEEQYLQHRDEVLREHFGK